MYCIDLKGKVALVTGSRRGLGKQIAITLAKAGANIVANSRKYDEEDKKLIKEISNDNEVEVLLAEGSTAVADDVRNVIDKTMKKFGKIDILVNNAGIIAKKPFIEIDEEEWRRVLDVNLNGTFLFSQAVAKIMVKQGEGRIINIASIAGKRGSRNYAHYAATKAAIINLTKTMAKELGRKGILVNAIDPGRIRTDMLLKSIKTERERWIDETAIGRIGVPEEVAGVVVFLSSNLSSYITGTTIEVDGGVLMD